MVTSSTGIVERHTGWLASAGPCAFQASLSPVCLASEISFFLDSSYGEGRPKTVIIIFNFWLFLMKNVHRCKICYKTAGFPAFHFDTHIAQTFVTRQQGFAALHIDTHHHLIDTNSMHRSSMCLTFPVFTSILTTRTVRSAEEFSAIEKMTPQGTSIKKITEAFFFSTCTEMADRIVPLKDTAKTRHEHAS